MCGLPYATGRPAGHHPQPHVRNHFLQCLHELPSHSARTVGVQHLEQHFSADLRTEPVGRHRSAAGVADQRGRHLGQEEAEELAEKQVAPRETELRSQLTKIGVLSIPEGRVAVEINGKRGHVPQNQVETILKRGGKVI